VVLNRQLAKNKAMPAWFCVTIAPAGLPAL
jgi:hypothetical protein